MSCLPSGNSGHSSKDSLRTSQKKSQIQNTTQHQETSSKLIFFPTRPNKSINRVRDACNLLIKSKIVQAGLFPAYHAIVRMSRDEHQQRYTVFRFLISRCQMSGGVKVYLLGLRRVYKLHLSTLYCTEKLLSNDSTLSLRENQKNQNTYDVPLVSSIRPGAVCIYQLSFGYDVYVVKVVCLYFSWVKIAGVSRPRSRSTRTSPYT